MKRAVLLLAACVVLASGCTKPERSSAVQKEKPPVFSLAWSEYPSWSVFGVAHEKGLVNGEEGKLGPIEQQWNVDIVLKETDYDTCLTLYGSGTVDAVCMTNIDSLAPCSSRPAVAILPTSTSVGADACIVVGVKDLDGLKGKTTFGLEKSVSQYAFERCLEKAGKQPKEFPFQNKDPGAAAQAMQTGQAGYESIMVWNPFVLQTLRTKDAAKVLFDSSTIPEEIIDMVVIGRDSLKKPGGEAFARAVAETFYEVNRLLADPDDGDETLVALGAKFSSLGLEDMKKVVEQTRFYKTPDAALALFESEAFQKKTTPMVTDFCVSHGIVKDKPTVGFNDDKAQLDFDTSILKKVQEEAKEKDGSEAQVPEKKEPAKSEPEKKEPAKE